MQNAELEDTPLSPSPADNLDVSRQSRTRRSLRLLVVLPTILALLGLGVISASRLFASVYASYGYHLAEADSPRLARARSALDAAIRFWPMEAEYHNQRGLLAVRAGDFDTAEAAYLRSLRLRPTWPYTWANLAQYRLTRGRTDALFTRLWQQGLELGPAEDRLHLAYSQIGLDNWYRLSRQQRNGLRQSLDYLLLAPNAETSLRDLTVFARRRRLQPLLCRLAGEAVNLTDWCARYTASRQASSN